MAFATRKPASASKIRRPHAIAKLKAITLLYAPHLLAAPATASAASVANAIHPAPFVKSTRHLLAPTQIPNASRILLTNFSNASDANAQVSCRQRTTDAASVVSAISSKVFARRKHLIAVLPLKTMIILTAPNRCANRTSPMAHLSALPLTAVLGVVIAENATSPKEHVSKISLVTRNPQSQNVLKPRPLRTTREAAFSIAAQLSVHLAMKVDVVLAENATSLKELVSSLVPVTMPKIQNVLEPRPLRTISEASLTIAAPNSVHLAMKVHVVIADNATFLTELVPSLVLVTMPKSQNVFQPRPLRTTYEASLTFAVPKSVLVQKVLLDVAIAEDVYPLMEFVP